MNWKTKALEELSQNAKVEGVPGQENIYLVTVLSNEGPIKTLVRLDEANERYHYMNAQEHALDSVSELIESMQEHLEVEQQA